MIHPSERTPQEREMIVKIAQALKRKRQKELGILPESNSVKPPAKEPLKP